MARRKDSPQKAAMREMMRDYLKNNDISIKDGTDVNGIMRDMMSVLLEGALDGEYYGSNGSSAIIRFCCFSYISILPLVTAYHNDHTSTFLSFLICC